MPTLPSVMRAVVYRGPNDLRVEALPIPRIGSGDLLVKVAACGVCPTDIKKIQYGTVPPPRIFGHETAGTIMRVGARVRGFKVGDRVALHHHVPCLKCHFCRHRAFAQCAQYKRTGITAGFEPAGGGYAEYVRVMSFVLPGVVKIPPRNSFEEGAMLEPVNTVLKAVRRLSLLRGDIVLVAGQGPIGLMFTRLLRLERMRVIAADLIESRLELARQFGARWTFLGSDRGRARHSVRAGVWQQRERRARSDAPYLEAHAKGTPSDVQSSTSPTLAPPVLRGPSSVVPPVAGRRVDSTPPVLRSSAEGGEGGQLSTLIQRATHGRGLDAAVIAVPSDEVARQAQTCLRGGGQLMLFAHTKRGDSFTCDPAAVCVDEKDLLGSYSADFTLQREVARLVFSRQLDVRPLITHRFPLEQTADAIALASHPAPDSLKIIVQSQSAV